MGSNKIILFPSFLIKKTLCIKMLKKFVKYHVTMIVHDSSFSEVVYSGIINHGDSLKYPF